jgi:hypothetical protein
MIDILIPLANKPDSNFIELKYCLRSIEKYGLNVGNIYIVGAKPNWIQNVLHIPMNDPYNKVFGKARNILNKILTGCKSEISENFIMFNDDFFLLQQTDLENYPYYSSNSSIPQIMNRPNHDTYKQTFIRTARLLNQNIISFECHRPILFNKNKFINTFLDIGLNYDYLIRTYYGIKNITECEEIKIISSDLKINHPTTYDKIKENIKDAEIFSTTDLAVNNEMLKVLEELYPNKSKYEV